MARSVSKFIYRTAMATALLGLAGLNGLDVAYAAPASVSSANASSVSASQASVSPAIVSQVNTAGPGWAAVGQLLQTFDGGGSSIAGSSSSSSSSKASSRGKAVKAAKASASSIASGSASASRVASRSSNLIDYQEMSVRCLGKKDWDSLSASQRSQFVASLKGLVEQRYYPRWRKIFGKGKITFQEESSQGGDILVRTKLLLGKSEEVLSWRVADQSGMQKIVSLSVSNSDLLERLKSRIKARQQKVGFDALLAWMTGHSSEDMGSSRGSAIASTGGFRAGASYGSSAGVSTGANGSTAGVAASGMVMPIAAVRSPNLSAGATASISD